MSSPPVIGGARLAQSLVCLCCVLEINVCPFVLFPLASDYHLFFSNFKTKMLPSPFSQMAFLSTHVCFVNNKLHIRNLKL